MYEQCIEDYPKLVRYLELIGIAPYEAPDIDSYTIYFCFFSARNYYEYGKKYIVLELYPSMFDCSCFKLGEFFSIEYIGGYQLYFGRKAIIDIFSDTAKSDYHFNSIYSFEHLPELKKEKKKRKRR